jgi:hypothetical protein
LTQLAPRISGDFLLIYQVAGNAISCVRADSYAELFDNEQERQHPLTTWHVARTATADRRIPARYPSAVAGGSTA